jgi:hypothetical protein
VPARRWSMACQNLNQGACKRFENQIAKLAADPHNTVCEASQRQCTQTNHRQHETSPGALDDPMTDASIQGRYFSPSADAQLRSTANGAAMMAAPADW